MPLPRSLFIRSNRAAAALPDSPRHLGAWAVLCGLLLTTAASCAHTATRPGASAPTPRWIDSPLPPAASATHEVDALQALGRSDLESQIVRLDRLLDLFDAARFDAAATARETLWTALGGHRSGVGPAATTEATQRMLDLALALEAAAETTAISPDHRAFISSAIALLSADLQQAASAEDLSIRGLAYREVVRRGHARVADNARWRLYDQARGTLVGAAAASPGDRLDVAMQALYVAQESVAELLDTESPQRSPTRPTPADLLALLAEQRDGIADSARWAPIVSRRALADAELGRTVLARLPASRSADWPAPSAAAFSGRRESGAPAVLAEAGEVVIDAGRPEATTLGLGEDRAENIASLTAALRAVLAQDGRGALLLFAPPDLPSTRLATVLQAVRAAQASSLELAIREPDTRSGRAPPKNGVAPSVLTALELLVVHPTDATSVTAGLANARITVHLTGRGPRISIAERLLSAMPGTDRELGALLDRVGKAYPRERVVRVALGPDVSVEQLAQLLEALVGSETPRFAAAGWITDDDLPSAGVAGADATLEIRAQLASAPAHAEIDQPFKLRGPDQAALERFVGQLGQCVPELESAAATFGVVVKLSLRDHKLEVAELIAPLGIAAEASKRFTTCVEVVGYGLRLRNHADLIEIEATLNAKQ